MPLLAPHSRTEDEVSGSRETGLVGGAARTTTVLASALGPLLVGYLFVVAVFALVTALASVSRFSVLGVLRAAGIGLLAAYQVPVTITGGTLGVLPMLGTILVFVLVASSAARAAGRLGCREPGQAVTVVAPIAALHSLTGVVVALIDVSPRVSVEPLTAFLAPGALSALFALVGVARRCGFTAAARERLDPVALSGLRAGALGMAGLLAAGALVYAIGLVLSFDTANRLFAANAPGFGSGAGMLLLSLGYLPNALAGTLSFLAGPGFSLGSVSMTPFQYSGGAVPGLPVLAVMPEHAGHWWPLLMLLPAAVGVLVGWSLRRSHPDAGARLRTVAIAGALVGFGCVLLGTLAGGRLGNGPYSPVSIPAGLLSVAAFGWIFVPGGLVVWLAGPRREVRPAVAEDECVGELVGELDEPGLEAPETDTESEDEPADEPADESEDEPEDEPQPEPEDEPADHDETDDQDVGEAEVTCEEPGQPG